MFIAGNGNVYISGNLSVSGNTTQINTITNFTTETANVVQTSYLAGNVSSNNGNITVQSNLAFGGSTTISVGNNPGLNGQFLQSTGTGLTWVTLSASSITNGTSNVTVNSSGPIVMGVNNSNVAAVTSTGILPSANLTYNLGSSIAWWNNIYGTAVHSQYADLAENYRGDKNYNPGTVLMFGGTDEVTLATADTTAVAGVVSTNPAHLMNGALQGSNIVPLALTGRVPCNVVGPISKGDLMVSAGFGFAKANNSAGVGQVIGKALEDFSNVSKGIIEVVVGRF
jgi:hypothetical protein